MSRSMIVPTENSESTKSSQSTQAGPTAAIPTRRSITTHPPRKSVRNRSRWVLPAPDSPLRALAAQGQPKGAEARLHGRGGGNDEKGPPDVPAGPDLP